MAATFIYPRWRRTMAAAYFTRRSRVAGNGPWLRGGRQIQRRTSGHAGLRAA
jgi:hypothetical protein